MSGLVDPNLHTSSENDAGRSAQEAWEDSPAHPRNWSARRKWTNTLLLAVTGLLSTTGSSIFVPAAPLLRTEFGISQEVATLTTSLYVLGLGAGPFVFAPISELYGRQRGYIISMIGFTAMNLGCCFVNNLAGLVVLRFLAGFFGSSGPGLGVATVSDSFEPRERGKPISIYSIGPMLGPVIGSMLGNYLLLIPSSSDPWRWPFRVLTILVGLNLLAIVFFVRESYAPVCERKWRAEREAKRKGEGELEKEERKVKAEMPKTGQTKEVIVRTFKRPPRMLANPICCLFATYYAFIYSIIYVFLVSFPLLYGRHDPPTGAFSYNWPVGTVGLSYVGLGIGMLSSAATAASTSDRIYRHLSERYGNNGEPEYRLVLTQIGMIIFPVGLFIWAWTAQAQTHWIGPVIGGCIFAYGLQLSFNSIQNFLVDAFFPYSAAAVAAATLLRSILGGVLPIFSQRLFINLGYGWGGTLLALVSLPAVPAPLVLFLVGGRLRERWKFKA
ncbi:hypothetical protein JCM10207_006991 [Rhodosporidiobolus poonsookiae]